MFQKEKNDAAEFSIYNQSVFKKQKREGKFFGLTLKKLKKKDKGKPNQKKYLYYSSVPKNKWKLGSKKKRLLS